MSNKSNCYSEGDVLCVFYKGNLFYNVFYIQNTIILMVFPCILHTNTIILMVFPCILHTNTIILMYFLCILHYKIIFPMYFPYKTLVTSQIVTLRGTFYVYFTKENYFIMYFTLQILLF